MLLDYIYLFIIIILVGSILFIINLSYEYRNSGKINAIEKFTNPTIIALPGDMPQLSSRIADFKANYANLGVMANNNQVIVDGNDYNRMNEQIKKNLEDAKFLKTEFTGIQPVKEHYPSDKLIKTIKSNYNSQFLSLVSNDINKYGIVVNDKCLTVRGASCPNNFCIQNCQDKLFTADNKTYTASDSQKFITKRISNIKDAAGFMKTNTGKINSKNVYPFNMFQSTVNNQCLSINDDGITVEPCNVNDLHQQWQISPDENICLLS